MAQCPKYMEKDKGLKNSANCGKGRRKKALTGTEVLAVPTKDNPECLKINHDIEDFRSSSGGYQTDSLSQEACQQLCLDGNFDFAGLMHGEYCLCSNETSDHEVLTMDQCDEPCSGNPDQFCGSADPDLLYVLIVEKMGTVKTVTVETSPEEPSIDEPVEVTITVDASTTFEVTVKFGDGTMATTQEETFTFSKYYKIPGEYDLHISAVDVARLNPAVFDEISIVVEDKKIQSELECPRVIEPGSEANCTALFIRGSQVVMEFQMTEDPPVSYAIADPVIIPLGQKIPLMLSEEDHFPDLSANEVLMPYLEIKTPSRLFGFEYYAKSEGSLKLLVLKPTCSDGEYCAAKSQCDAECSPYVIHDCGDVDSLCSYIGKCVNQDSPPQCFAKTPNSVTYEVKHSLEVPALEEGYQFFQAPDDDIYDTEPGDIIGFEGGGTSPLRYRNATLQELEDGLEDVANDDGLGVRFYLRALIVEPVNITLQQVYNETGNYSVSMSASNDWTEGSKATSFISVQFPFSNMSFTFDPPNVVLGAKATAIITVQGGSDITLEWDYNNGTNEKQDYPGVTPEEGYSYPFTCNSPGTYTITVNASNLWLSEMDSKNFSCFLPITDKWVLESNAPQVTPPGFVEFDLKFTDESSSIPLLAEIVIDFGDGTVDDPIPIKEDQTDYPFTHNYISEGTYNVTANISNVVEFGIFTIQVDIYEKMGELSVTPYYVKEGIYPDDKKEMGGPNKTDTPVGTTVYFECNITGYVLTYFMEWETTAIEGNITNNVLSHEFDESGEWKITFYAWSPVEQLSNPVTLQVRAILEVAGLLFEASTQEPKAEETVDFLITVETFDAYACIMFDGGDGGMKQGFGHRETCLTRYNEGEFKWVDRPSFPPDDDSAEYNEVKRIVYQYPNGGEFPASVEVFNTISEGEKKELMISVLEDDYKAPALWIDGNSTNIATPLERFRGRAFRLETTAMFRDNQSYFALHRWTVFQVDESGNQLEEIDVTSLKTHNCSAIRISKRFLDFGLYKFEYSLTVMTEPDPPATTPPSIEDDYNYYYYEDDDDDFDESELNRTLLGQRTCFTYLRIIPTPLIPMVIEGGASYILRGFGQKVFLQPLNYTEDPDYPEDKSFTVTWFCLRSDKNENFPASEKYTYPMDNPSGPILDRSMISQTTNQGGCFGKGPGLMEIGSSNYLLTTDMFYEWDAVYEIIAVIRKDTKVTEGHLMVKVIEKRPPSIRVMCEKRVACFPQIEGQFINPNSWVPLNIQCLEDCGEPGELKFKWSLFIFNITTSGRREIEWEKHVVVDNDRMGINKSLYIEYPEANAFLVEVIGELPDPMIPQGVSSMYLIRNNPPEGGSCRINATYGMALLDGFLIEFLDWTDKDDHNLTDFSIYVKLGDESLRLQYGFKNRVEVVLPYGDIEVWCAVEDTVGGVAFQSVANFSTELPTEDELREYEESRFFDKCLAEGNMALASQIIIAKNSVSMEYKRLRNITDDFGDVDDAAVDAKWREYLELDGIDSSYFTPQAREEILEEMREDLQKQRDKDAKKKTRELEKLVKLPMDALPDAEVFGGALSSIADNGPINKKGKNKVMDGMKDMFRIMNETEVPHPEDKGVVLSQFGNIADTMAGSMAESMIGGNFLYGELKRAEEELDHNVSEPNYFLMYVEGSRKEVEERVKDRAVDAAKDDQVDMAKGMVGKLKDMIGAVKSGAMQDLMVGESPFTTESRNGFQMTLVKRPASELSGSEINQGGASITLPDACVILGKENCDLNGTSMGVQAIRWTQPLESYGENSDSLSDDSSVIQLDITDRNGNSSLIVANTTEPFVICIPHVHPDEDEDGMEYIIPDFKRDDDILVYHQLPIESADLGVLVDLKPDKPTAPLVLLYKYGNRSSLVDYDGIVQLQDIPYMNETYSLFIPPETITEAGKILFVAVGHFANHTNPSLFFNSPGKYNLTVVNMTNQFSTNYSIKISATGCYYFDEEEEKWSSDGCLVSSASITLTCCECNHLTSFGSGFFVTPNVVDFDYVFAHAAFGDNITIYCTLIVTFSVFVIFLIYARWTDRKDVEKLGASPLTDNDAADKYLYEILIFTGHQRKAGTKSNVFFIVSGEDDETEVRHICDDKRPIFSKSSVDVFVMAVPRSLGQLNYLRMWHDNSGKGKWASWYVQYVIFRDVQTGHKFEFIVNRWFAVEEDDGLIDRLIPVAGREQSTEFSHLFSTSSRRNLADSHLWFSVFLRPPRSRFTRVQRVACCMAVLYLSMLVNAMYYQRTTEQPSSGAFKFGPFSLSPEQIAVGLISNFIIFPPTFIMIFFFRKSRPRKLRPSRIEEALKKQRADWKKKNPEPLPDSAAQQRVFKNDEEAQLFRKKKKFTLPWWCVFFGWFFVVASIAVSIFFLWAYGIQFGDEKTMKWLTSLIISFFSSVLITQPIKILLMAIIVSCMCRSVDYDEDDADEDEEDPTLAKDEEFLHGGTRVKRAAYKPMDLEALEEARKEREKEIKMYEVIREILAYFFFLWIVMILSYGNRDPNNFFLRETLVNGFIKPGDLWVEFNYVTTERKFWNWTYNALVPELFAGPWYNGRTPLGLRLYLDDRNNLKIGYAVLRQVRIKPRSCEVSWLIKSVTPECAGYGSVFFEDGSVYTKGWKEVHSIDTPVPPEYKYLSATQLKGYPFWGQLDWYGGGGYVVPLVAKKDTDVEILKKRLRKLEREGWIDRHTRAVFVEFGTYNAQVNLFCAMTILAEFMPGGGIVPYFHIDPLRLLNYHDGFGLFQMIIEILFVVFTIFFTVRELLSICREGVKYFTEYWNIAEIATIIVGYTAIFIHIYKMVITKEILRIFTETEGTGYVKLQEAVILDEVLCYLIGFIMSISTLKFLKLLRFNRRIGVLSSTLRKCAEELQGYGVCLLIVFGAFVVLFWLLLGRHVRAFSTFVYSFESSISMMLKKFNYDDMHAASPIFTPIAFFTFSLATAVVLINILLTIIIQSFEDVNHDVSQQSNEYELLDFFLNRLKMATGCGKAKVRPLPSVYREKKKPKDTVASFPEKVDKLVDFINTVYFENQMDFNSKEFLKKMKGADVGTSDDSPERTRKKTIPNKKMERRHILKDIQDTFDDF